MSCPSILGVCIIQWIDDQLAAKPYVDKSSTKTEDTKGWANPVAEFLLSVPRALGLIPNPEGKATQSEIQVRPMRFTGITDTKTSDKASGSTVGS